MKDKIFKIDFCLIETKEIFAELEQLQDSKARFLILND